MQPLIQVYLKFLHGQEEFLPEDLPEELVKYGSVKPFHEAAGASVVGSNCGNGLAQMIAIGGEFVKSTNLPVLIQSNASLPQNMDGETVYLETPDFYRGKIAGLIDAGVRIIGGCCDTTPEHIRMIRNAVNSLT